MAALPESVRHKQTIYLYEWKIENYSSHNDKKIGDSIVSPIFSDWYMKIFPKGETEKLNDHVSVFLYNNRDVDVKASYTCSFLNKCGEKVKICSIIDRTFSKLGYAGWGQSKSLSTNDLVDPVRGFIINDTLTVRCKISMGDYFVESLNDGSEELLAFEKLIDNERFSDVTIKVGRKKILAHKMILSSRSSVFQAMFAHDMKENQENIVEIEGIKYNIFMELLRFIYAGKVNNVEIIAEELFVAADKYAVYRLTEKCESAIMNTIDNDKVLDCLKMADACNAIRLKDKLIDYIKSTVKDIVSTLKFEEFAVAHPRLSLEVTRKLLGVS